jgi:hypothetical protein
MGTDAGTDHPDRVMCSLVAPSTMASSWADERRSARETLEELGGPIDQVVLEWRGERPNVSEARTGRVGIAFHPAMATGCAVRAPMGCRGGPPRGLRPEDAQAHEDEDIATAQWALGSGRVEDLEAAPFSH